MIGARLHPHRRRRTASAAFTLIEMVVVIAVILVLVALTVTVGVTVLQRAEVRDTENILRLLDTAVSEWELQAGRQIRYGMDNQPCNQNERYELTQIRKNGSPIASNPPWGDDENAAFIDAEYTSDRLWAILSRTTTVQEIVARINPEFVEQDEVWMDPNDKDTERPTFHFTDVWGTEILAVLPGRPFNANCPGSTDGGSGYRRDPDGTIRTPFENWYGVAADRRIFFVSAGPSGRFGNLRLHRTQAEINGNDEWQQDIRRAADNIYSYPVRIDEARPTP